MNEPAHKCENNAAAIFMQSMLRNCFFAFKIAYFCCFSLGGNLDSLDFLKERFIKFCPGEA